VEICLFRTSLNFEISLPWSATKVWSIIINKFRQKLNTRIKMDGLRVPFANLFTKLRSGVDNGALTFTLNGF
jgi:hypothetical protein